jgi:hypothetical protein
MRSHVWKSKVARATLAALVLAMPLPRAAWPAAPEQPWRVLRGADLARLDNDREVGDGTHYSYRFGRDGVLGGTDMGQAVRGRWRATARQLCWQRLKPAQAEACYEVRQRGAELRFFRDGYEAFSATLSPINSAR